MRDEPAVARRSGRLWNRAIAPGARTGDREVATFEPAKTFGRRKALDAAAKYAARIGDITALEAAVTQKLEEEAKFAGHVKAMFPHGAPVGNKRAAKNRVVLEGHSVSADGYCEDLGFKFRTVRKWYRLIDDDVRKAEVAKRVERTWRIVLGEAMAHVGQNSGQNEWYTPVEYVEAVQLGDIARLERVVAPKHVEAAA